MFFIKTNREAKGMIQQAVPVQDNRNGKTKDDDTFGFHHLSKERKSES